MRLMTTKNLYDIAKWAALVALPALAVLVTALTPVWDIPRGDDIALTIVAVDAFLGALVGVESARHTKREYGKYELGRPVDSKENN